MSSVFVESCVGTVANSAAEVERQARGRPRAHQLMKALAGKNNILITTHEYPDPDAMAGALGLRELIATQLPQSKLTVAVKGTIGRGLNAIFAQQSNALYVQWEQITLSDYDAVVLVDTQPSFSNSPLPKDVLPLAVIDHHPPLRGRKPQCAFCDVRSDIGASASIIFGYFMEMEAPISRELGAMLLFAIETDLAGAASQPDELDNMALSALTLIADPRKLYKMRYADLPRSYYTAFARGLNNAVYCENALVSHLDQIDSPEKPAILADILLRFEEAQWALVTAVDGRGLVMSLRTYNPKFSAATLMSRLVRDLGEGGGHRTKAGGHIPLPQVTDSQIERVRKKVIRRYFRALGIDRPRPQKLVDP